MSRTEKLRVMEAIWTDLSASDAELESPAWHADVLRETEERFSRGEERIVDWESAKRELRNRFE
ncbi:MAG: addiction module protein [Candidatus Marinimicrobia bacterium]|nr:addiction module protein [Candidatus Neomarinimicrobiota bacterium]